MRGTCLWVAALSIVCAAAPAAAENTREQAEALVRDGIQDARAQRFKDAAEKFERAFKLMPTAEILHNMARAHEELGNLPQAHAYFTQALRMTPEYTFAKEARTRIPKLEAKLSKTHGLVRVKSTPSEVEVTLEPTGQPAEGHLTSPVERWVPAGKLKVTGRKTDFQAGSQVVDVVAGVDAEIKIVLRPETKEGFLDVSANAQGAMVFIAGKELGATPLRGITYPTGSYALTIRAEGYRDFETQVIVQPDQVTTVAATMLRVGEKSPDGNGITKTDGEGGGTSSLTIAGGVVLGVGVAALGVGIGLVASAYADRGAVAAIKDNEEFLTARKELKTREAAGFVVGGVGVAALGAGLGLLLYALGEDAPPAEGGVSWMPLVQPLPGGAGVGATLTW